MPGDRPMFSVVIPTYNRADKVLRAVESVLKQTFQDYDIWVIDDGSSDDTTSRLSPYMDKIHYRKVANGGASAARNIGITNSGGEWIAFLDSDDGWKATKLEAFARAIGENPEAGLFYSSIEVVDPSGNWLRANESRAVKGDAYQALLRGNFLALSTVVLRRSVLEKAGLFDPKISGCEDWDLWLRVARLCPIQKVDGNLTIFETSAPDKLSANTKGWLKSHDDVIEKAFRLNPGISPAAQREIRAELAFVKGRICLEAQDESAAQELFKQALSIQPTLWKAYLFRFLCYAPGIRDHLPNAFRRRLHLSSSRRNQP